MEGVRNAAKSDCISNSSTHTESANGVDCWMDPRETIPRTRMNAVVVDQRPMVMLEVVVRAHKGAGARGNQRKNERNVKGSLEAGGLKRRGWAQHRKCWYTRYAYFHLRRVCVLYKL